MRVVATDEELLRAWGAGDQHAGEELLRCHFEPLFAFFRGKLDDLALVEDLVQRTMMAVVRSHAGFRADSSFRAWLFTIARHELFRELRSRHRKGEAVDFSLVSIAELGMPTPSEAVEERVRERALVLALRSIPLDLQIAIELSYWEGLSSSEIAEVLGIPMGTVKSRVRRARDLLREALQARGVSPGEAHETVDNLGAWAQRVREVARPPRGSPSSIP